MYVALARWYNSVSGRSVGGIYIFRLRFFWTEVHILRIPKVGYNLNIVEERRSPVSPEYENTWACNAYEIEGDIIGHSVMGSTRFF